MSIAGVSCPDCGYAATTLRSCLYIAPSPFHHLFNKETSREEISAARPQLRIFTDAVRGELYDVEARVARLRQSLQVAEQHLATAKRVLNAHVMLNSPVESLPPEILLYIFSLSFEKPFSIFEAEPQMPWLLGQVCRHWRALAWQTPTLWNLFEGRDHIVYNDYYGTRLEEVLNRSGNSALRVSLEGLAPNRARILARHAPRLLELELRCWFETLSEFKDAPELSILTKLSLTVQYAYDTTPPEREPFDIVSKAPRLTHVGLTFHVPVDVPRVFVLPWLQITHLELDLGTHNYHHIYHILSQCRNLVSFTDIFRDNPYRLSTPYLLPTPSSIYIFAHLTFLKIRSSLAVLSCMQCPALRMFTLRGASEDVELTETDCEDFRVFMERSRCTLQKVTFIPEHYMRHENEYSAPLRKLLSFVSHVPKVTVAP
ncbi:hypothetical protein CPB85DRAFT_1570120 [Mucidula mucida]|nr:hypothetical protein CPB85DRAFT_1570120 [Mucidula mucida]